VEEAAKALKAGYGPRMMLEVSPEFTFGVLSPAFVGCEGNLALQEFKGNGCTFLKNGLCEIHTTSLLPLECRFCHHARLGKGEVCHRAIEQQWRAIGQSLVNTWALKVGLWDKHGNNGIGASQKP
jgi:hypothetical protein